MITWDEGQDRSYQLARSMGVLRHRYTFYRLWKTCRALGDALGAPTQAVIDDVIDALEPSPVKICDLGRRVSIGEIGA